LEHLSDASSLGKLLVLPANVRLHWKVIVRYKRSSLFGLDVSDKGKNYNIDTRCQPNIYFLLFITNSSGISVEGHRTNRPFHPSPILASTARFRCSTRVGKGLHQNIGLDYNFPYSLALIWQGSDPRIFILFVHFLTLPLSCSGSHLYNGHKI
jgi:hypothetical protein